MTKKDIVVSVLARRTFGRPFPFLGESVHVRDIYRGRHADLLSIDTVDQPPIWAA
jgi:hypothetical protein